MTSAGNGSNNVKNAVGRINRIGVLTIDAYGVAVKNGYKGTVEEWLESLKAFSPKVEVFGLIEDFVNEDGDSERREGFKISVTDENGKSIAKVWNGKDGINGVDAVGSIFYCTDTSDVPVGNLYSFEFENINIGDRFVKVGDFLLSAGGYLHVVEVVGDTYCTTRCKVKIKGKDGVDGADGVSPTVAVEGMVEFNGFVSGGMDGENVRAPDRNYSVVRITDAVGTKEFEVYDGRTPWIGPNGNWYIGLTDTGKPSQGTDVGGSGTDTVGSIFYSTETRETYDVGTEYFIEKDTIDSQGRNIRVGDFIISSGGWLFIVTQLSTDACQGECLLKMRGTDGKDGQNGEDAVGSIFYSTYNSGGSAYVDYIHTFEEFNTSNIKFGDFIITACGWLCKVTYVADTHCMGKFVMRMRGNDGQPGYTPVKGVDYFDGKDGQNGQDGKDGYTPQKGVDYFDGEDGKDGVDGQDGATFTPTVSADGTLSWSNDKGLTNPAPVNIKGEKGEKGDTGEKGDKGDPGGYALTSGFFTFIVDEEGNLYVCSAEESNVPTFEFDAETGDLFVITGQEE